MKYVLLLAVLACLTSCRRVERSWERQAEEKAQRKAERLFEGRWVNRGSSGAVAAYNAPEIGPGEFWVPKHFDVTIEDGYCMDIRWPAPETHVVPGFMCEFRNDLSPLREKSHIDGIAFGGGPFGLVFSEPSYTEAWFYVCEDRDFAKERRYGPFTRQQEANKSE